MSAALSCPYGVDAVGTFLFISGENTQPKREGSGFTVCRGHQALPAIVLAFYFVSEPTGFEKYILYRKGGNPNE